MSDKDLVFIASGGRTGTQFLGLHLSEMIEDAFSVHEPDLYHGLTDARTWRNVREFGIWHILVGRALRQTGTRVLGNAYLSGKVAHEDAVRRVRASRTRYIRRRPEGLVIESNLQWSLILPVLRDTFPQAKVVCLTRDEETWVGSWLRRGIRYTDADRVGANRINPVMLGTMESSEWLAMSAEDKLRWEWRYVNGLLREFAAADPLAKLFTYEDLFVAPDRADTFRDLLTFVAAHGARRHNVHFDPTLLERRENASVVR